MSDTRSESPEHPPPRRRRPLPDALVALGRPLLRVAFAMYLHEVKKDLFPRDAPVTLIDGVDPQGILFIGDVAVAGHGVLSSGLTVGSRTAAALSLATGRGASIRTLAAHDLTIAAVARRRVLDAETVEIAFIAVGIPDVLLATASETWARSLRIVAEKIQSESRFRAVTVVVSGIPPLSQFRPIPASVRRAIDRQVDRLNAVSVEVAATTPGMTFVPFPEWRIGDMYIKRMFSWKTMHEAWGETLAAGARG